ncbi:NAD-dependent epimerase/dehydratase family protein [Glaciibacter flavus]|uniref:NAD-dependent epimerase/dehydratase family protein n=1 Tax=Orlajensenia flava TaxID=2565934 RepID=UPI001F22AD17
MDGTQKVLAAARRAGVRRVLLASSVNAVGFVPYGRLSADQVLVARPDTYHGVSKAALEALGNVYARRGDGVALQGRCPSLRVASTR